MGLRLEMKGLISIFLVFLVSLFSSSSYQQRWKCRCDYGVYHDGVPALTRLRTVSRWVGVTVYHSPITFQRASYFTWILALFEPLQIARLAYH